MKKYLAAVITAFLISLHFLAFSQENLINPDNITIARDTFGVPHIFAPTDAEAAYGLAWAHAEDDFEHMQLNLLAAKKMLGRVQGKDGVLFDYAMDFLSIDSIVDARYEFDLSPQFRQVVDGYTQGINAYANAHPKERIKKKAFPVTPQDVIKGYVLTTSLMAGLGLALKAVRENRMDEFFSPNEIGSNAFAITGDRTEDGKTYLAINSHQPLEGRFAWYEAHVQSGEGWDIIGGLFPGGLSIFVGSNRHLGWAHTVNYHNFGDIYKLKINPDNDGQYKFNNEWRDFYVKKVWLKVKIKKWLPPIPVRRKIKMSTYGPVLETDHGMFAFRFPGHKDIRSGEQWYKMNKATNFNEFESALKMQALPLFNVIYADVDHNILLHSGGMVPLRNPELEWEVPITKTDVKYVPQGIVPYEDMPTIHNPDCGFVYNANNTPLHATGDECNWSQYFPGCQLFEYNRGERFKKMLESHNGKFTWDDFHRIKFDKSYDNNGSYMSHFNALYTLDEEKYPHISGAIKKLKDWNLSGEKDNINAALAMVVHEELRKDVNAPFAFLMIREQKVSEEQAVRAVEKAQEFLLEKHGTLDIELGQVQRHIRGDVSIPASGLREVPRAADPSLYDEDKGIFRVEKGDGYIQMVKFSKEGGAEIQSINAYGASSREDSPHFTDQMEMFQNEEFKEMTFDKQQIIDHAEDVYHPK